MSNPQQTFLNINVAFPNLGDPKANTEKLEYITQEMERIFDAMEIVSLQCEIDPFRYAKWKAEQK